MKTENKGYILSVVLCISILLLVIVGSLFQFISTQRRLSVRKELLLQANNAAETAIDYAYSSIINDINANTIRQAASVPSTGYKEFTFAANPIAYLTTNPSMNTGYTGKIGNLTYTTPTVRILPAGPSKRYFVSGSDPLNAGSPVMNQWVNQRLIPVVAQVTATQSGKTYSAYVQKSIASIEVSLFQYAIFFQGQLHMHRGFRPMGDVHTNGMLFLNAHDDDYATYNGAVSATGHIYRGSTFDGSGDGCDAYGYVPVTSAGDADFSTDRSPVVSPEITGDTFPHLKILVGETTSTYEQFTGSKDFRNDPSHWKDWAKKTFNGNLQDKSHEVPSITLVGAAGYRQDVAGTAPTNEFNNGPYKLIQPTLPSSATYDYPIRMKDNSNNLQANASLILRIEYNNADTITLHRIADGKWVTIAAGVVSALESADPAAVSPDVVGNFPTLSRYSDPWRMFVLKGYRVTAAWDPTDKAKKDVHDYLGAITLPDKVFGAANADATAVPVAGNLKMEDFDVALGSVVTVASTLADATTLYKVYNGLSASNKDKFNDNSGSGPLQVQITKGLFDSRLGRGVAPITIDIDALKDIMEAPLANFAPAPDNNRQFRIDFDPTAPNGTYKKWNGLIYIEFPTSLVINTAPAPNTKNGISTLPFSYESNPELLHPDRAAPSDTRANRTDNIIPIAKELRRYPPANVASLNSTILDAQYAIPAVQLINGRSLPHPNSADTSEGFTIATNAPLYLVGNYNSDGDFTTGSKISSNVAGDYAVLETDPVEIPAAIFCDTFTVLSNGWGVGGVAGSNRVNSFYGANNASTASNAAPNSVGKPPGRPAKRREAFNIAHFSNPTLFTYPASNPASGNKSKPYVEISACVATGEYPIFEFFTHALESYKAMYDLMSTTSANPIIFKGSLVGMFHSEIQHIKQAYGRSTGNDIQSYWQQHGAYAIAGSRYHQMLIDGNFPPGTPKAYLTSQKEFSLLSWSDSADATILTNAGFTANP